MTQNHFLRYVEMVNSQICVDKSISFAAVTNISFFMFFSLICVDILQSMCQTLIFATKNKTIIHDFVGQNSDCVTSQSSCHVGFDDSPSVQECVCVCAFSSLLVTTVQQTGGGEPCSIQLDLSAGQTLRNSALAKHGAFHHSVTSVYPPQCSDYVITPWRVWRFHPISLLQTCH